MKNKVLIVDDNIELGELLSILIEQRGLVPDVHKDYNFKLERSYEDSLYMAFLDFNCPPEGGYEWLRHNGLYVPANRRVLMSAGVDWEESAEQGYQFQGWALFTMFFGIALKRIFDQIWKNITKTFKTNPIDDLIEQVGKTRR